MARERCAHCGRFRSRKKACPCGAETCPECGEVILEGEGLCTDDDRLLCLNCWSEEAFTCCLCGEDTVSLKQHDYLVVAAEGEGVAPGLYRVKRLPYYTHGYIAAHLFPGALERIGDVPEDADTDDYPCGHLCEICQDELSLKKEEAAA